MDQKSGELVISCRKGVDEEMHAARPSMIEGAVLARTLSSKLFRLCRTTGALMKSLV